MINAKVTDKDNDIDSVFVENSDPHQAASPFLGIGGGLFSLNEISFYHRHFILSMATIWTKKNRTACEKREGFDVEFPVN